MSAVKDVVTRQLVAVHETAYENIVIAMREAAAARSG